MTLRLGCAAALGLTSLLALGSAGCTRAEGDGGRGGGGSGGAAECLAGQTRCDGVCTTLVADPLHCGACGTACEVGAACEAGTCQPAPVVLTATCTESFAEEESCAAAPGTTYYVSTSGSDASDGLTEDTPVQTLERASQLPVEPGDRVLFRCGDVWRGETLVLQRSGSDCHHIVYGSYPAACPEQPRISGSQPIVGWIDAGGGVWSADLTAGENAGRFPNGINQLFRGEQRLPLGRWPNLDDGDFPGGYAHLVTSAGNVVGDPALPSGDWSGAVFHHFSIRWLLLNTEVTSSGDGTLTLANELDCYDGCGDPAPEDPADFGWGYFLADHRLTLDRSGEWYYDRAASTVYLVASAAPTDIEGSVVPAGVVEPKDPTNDEGFAGLVTLGANLGDGLHHVVVENLRLENGWRDGIGTPINPNAQLTDVIVRCNTVRNPDSKGLHLGGWALDVGQWRGGERVLVVGNVFDGANHNGIRTLASDAVFQDNTVANTALLANLGPSGLGCRFGDANCTSNGDGFILERYDVETGLSDHVTLRRNRVDHTGHCGIDVLGSNVTIEENVVDQSCLTKGDCGAICVGWSPGITIRRNVVRDVISPVEGFNSSYHEAFGFGLYIESSAAECSENTVVNTQGYGVIYQGTAVGDVVGNTFYGNEGRVHVFAGFGGTIESLTDNVIVGTLPLRLMFTEADGRILASDRNTFFQPYTSEYISMQDADWVGMDLAAWQAFSGQDAASTAAWLTLAEGAAPVTELFVNDTAEEQTLTLEGAYVDLTQEPVTGTLTLAPFTSCVLVAE